MSENYKEFRNSHSRSMLEKKMIEDGYSSEESKSKSTLIDEEFRNEKVKSGREKITVGIILIVIGIILFFALMISVNAKSRSLNKIAIGLILGGGALIGKGSSDINTYKVSLEEDANLPYYKRNR